MRIFLLPLLIGIASMVVACQPSTPAPTSSMPVTTEQKMGDTTKTGTVTGSAGAYFLQVPGEQPLAIDSYSIELHQYLGSQVTVTGQYSGNTLFIGKIQ